MNKYYFIYIWNPWGKVTHDFPLTIFTEKKTKISKHQINNDSTNSQGYK